MSVPDPIYEVPFLDRPRDGKISVLLVHLIGAETERYAAEPVYSVTGKGALRSKGVEGLREEKELEPFLRSDEGRPFVDRALKLIDDEACRVAVSNMEKGASSPFA